ncbi:exodeoxyribonuclease V subunit alpha [Desulfococcus sp.]|uniref:exodeoxyribonuclease V subunit alpha n=1 Tax=Desulfococcus sp. TaxID=2025834 RepID=UPI00359336AD
MDATLRQTLYASGLFTWLDIHFAAFISRIAWGAPPEVSVAAALVSRNRRMGHLCLDLVSAAGEIPSQEFAAAGISLPPARAWADTLTASSVVGRPGEVAPLVLDDGLRLYLHRYWEYQTSIVEEIRKRSETALDDIDTDRLAEGMARLFPGPPAGESAAADDTDWQKVAAFAAVSRRFSVISGGPGTGKTATVAKILALLLEQAGGAPLRIALAAPTGKAAARLREAIVRGRSHLDSPLRELIPDEVTTLHRLLGSLPDSPFFRHTAEHPLPVDLVVVDEASMVDVALMAKLIQAVPPKARLILLGDRDQLASVEAGAVLGDICDTGTVHQFSGAFCRALGDITGEALACPGTENSAPGLSDSIVLLRKSYRFGENSGIARASREINAGNGKSTLAVLESDACPDVRWRALPRSEGMARAIRDAVIGGYGPYLACRDDPPAAFQAFDRFRILAALRQGPFGVARLNEIAEDVLRGEGLIQPKGTWYPGRPVMVTRNDYPLRLFNGDVGITLQDPRGKLRVCFPDAREGVRSFSPLRLPEHETVYAMTVHKSQGSEFGHVALILPDQESPVMTRELLYTGITRAVRSVEVWGVASLLVKAAGRPIERRSGLRDALWGTRRA